MTNKKKIEEFKELLEHYHWAIERKREILVLPDWQSKREWDSVRREKRRTEGELLSLYKEAVERLEAYKKQKSIEGELTQEELKESEEENE